MSTLLGLNTSFYNSILAPQGVGGQILARVDKVILGPTDANGNPDPDFEANGRWASIGCIKYTVLYGGQPVTSDSNAIARPYYPNIIQYPTWHEIVELVPGPSTDLNNDGTAKTLYYKSPINLWNSVHHNALPNPQVLSKQTVSPNNSYQDTAKGATYAAATSSQTIALGNTFGEKSYLKNLRPFEGDLILNGRWGHSIRFGSTVKNSGALNSWSSAGEDGDPIIMIRNGQGERKSPDVFVPTIEDINKDGSSIYLTYGQVVIINDLSNFILDTFTVNSKLEETQVQRPSATPISTDTKSPISQSKQELEYAQASAQTVVQSTVPQSKTIMQINQTPTGSQPTATVITQTKNPDGTVTTSNLNVLLDPFAVWNAGQIGTNAINTPNKTEPTTSTVATTNNNPSQAPVSTTANQDVLPEGLEVITAEESTIRFNFDIDEVDAAVQTEGDRESALLNDPTQQELQKRVEETESEKKKGEGAKAGTGDDNWKRLDETLRTLYKNRADWKENGANPNILSAYAAAGAPQKSDSLAWCAAFAAYVLKTAGISYLKYNLSSTAYANYGTKLDLNKPETWRQWDIVVWEHTDKPGTGHVSFLSGVTGTGKTLAEQISALGGNQGNGLRVSRYPFPDKKRKSGVCDMKLIAVVRGPWIPPDTLLAKASGEIGGSTV